MAKPGQATGPLPEKASLVPASVILQQLHESAPKDQFTLGWLTSRLEDQSFELLLLLLGILAAVPGIGVFASLLIVICASQMAIGRQAPYFPRWMLDHPLPAGRLAWLVPHVVRALQVLEQGIRPRGPAPIAAAKRIAAIVMTLLNVRILLVGIPLTNVLPAIVIAFIALTCLEEDALWLPISIAVGLAFLAVDVVLVWNILHHHGPL